MAALPCMSECQAADTGETRSEPDETGRPMLGITLGLVLSVPLWAGLWCATMWI